MSKELQAHELADIFPMMDSNAFALLISDVRENGLEEPIVLLDGKILDGRNRYKAMLRVDPSFSPSRNPKNFIEYKGNSAFRWVV